MYYEQPALSLPELRLAAIKANKRVETRPIDATADDDPSFFEADRLFRDVSGERLDPIEDLTGFLEGAGGTRLSGEDWCQRCETDDDPSYIDAGVAHFLDDLQIEVWDFSARRQQDPDFDIERDILSLGSADGERSSLSRITVFTKAPWSGGPFGPPVASPPPSNISPHQSQSGAVRFAVMDTGIPQGYGTVHAHLQNAVDQASSDDDSPIFDKPPELLMDAGHGLFILDIACRLSPNIAPAYMPRVTNDETGLTISEFDIVTHLETLVKKVKFKKGEKLLVNMSFSGTTPASLKPAGLDKALQRLDSKGDDILVVAAAGNDASTSPHWPAALAATNQHLVSAGALDGSNQVAQFSNRGSWVTSWAPGTDIVAAFLEGVNKLPTPYPGDEFPLTPGTEPWAKWSGTSFAVPHVAAAIANQAASTGSTLLQAWNALQQAHANDHPVGSNEPGIVIV